MVRIALILSLVHILYYLYFFIGDYIIKMARSRNIAPNMTVLRLMGEYKVDVRMFNYNGQPLGFAWIRTIWLNTRLENLRKKGKASPDWMIKWAFFHELGHIKRKHKLKTLAIRFAFAMVPMLLIINPILFTVAYIGLGYVMYMMEQLFEDKANDYANSMMNEPKTLKSESNN